ncbi:hypothetical protein BJ508DRAFT_314713 [Ascobolus immersus RN42]|uniref:Uncharacterized protein n=1 Tax=Ascobolus immersus RN42 TaxID=1160509 RepID=A0A3N4HFY0_ASCIM|nr:hypothetical protein BJ508DRAFT_314713 [Ascobolus immersus RN42]
MALEHASFGCFIFKLLAHLLIWYIRPFHFPSPSSGFEHVTNTSSPNSFMPHVEALAPRTISATTTPTLTSTVPIPSSTCTYYPSFRPSEWPPAIPCATPGTWTKTGTASRCGPLCDWEYYQHWPLTTSLYTDTANNYTYTFTSRHDTAWSTSNGMCSEYCRTTTTETSPRLSRLRSVHGVQRRKILTARGGIRENGRI